MGYDCQWENYVPYLLVEGLYSVDMWVPFIAGGTSTKK